jgi:predicted extracellular nuclease
MRHPHEVMRTFFGDKFLLYVSIFRISASLHEGNLMEKNRILMILIVVCIALGLGSIILQDSNSSAGKNCSYSNISIHFIQGAGHKSPLAGCSLSGIQGIVTLVTSKGFYMQEPHPDNDNRTSEGILVYTGSPPKNIKKGDLAYVNGIVNEYFQDGRPLSLSVTEIANPTYTTTHSNIMLAPVLLGIGGLVPPDTVIEDDAFGNISTNNSFDPGTDGIDFYESLEGMSVLINNAVVVGPAKPTNHPVVYVLSDNGSLASIRTPSGGIISRPRDYNPERIALDIFTNSSEAVNVGDFIKGPVVGVIDYSKYNYEIVVDKKTPLALTHGPGNSSYDSSHDSSYDSNNSINDNSTQSAAGDQITIAAYNVQDLSYNLKTKKFWTLAEQIVEDLGAPDIVALEEIKGDNSTKDGSDIYKTLNLLTENISIASNGKFYYSNISIPDKNSTMNVAILYRTDRGLSFRGLSTGNPRENVTVTRGPHISPNPGWIYPRDPAFETGLRKPLAAEFAFRGQSLFVIANHFKAKDSKDDRLFGEYQPPRSITDDKRHKQAQIVHNFVKEILNSNSTANVVVLGDLNDFQFSETLNILKGNLLTNPLENLSIEEQYTYNFEGNSQDLDHILISKNLVHMSPEFKAVHINADFGIQTSDHDPVELRLKFP